MMFHTISAVFLASELKWNKLSAAMGVFITNPLTAPLVYQMTYTVGKFIIAPTGVDPVPVSFSLTSVIEIPKGAPEVLWILTVGGPDIGSGSKIKLLVQYRGDRVSRFQPAGIRKYVEDLK